MVPEDCHFARQVISRRLCIRIKSGAQRPHFSRHLLIFKPTPRGSNSVRPYYAIVIKFATVERLTIAIRAGERTPAGVSMPEPHSDGPGHRLWVDPGPVHLPGLQFHNSR